MALETTPFDPAAYVGSPEAAQEYLAAAFESNEPAIINDAIGVVARARGMSRLAEETGLTRQALYKALDGGGNPEFATVMKVLAALGLRLTPQAV